MQNPYFTVIVEVEEILIAVRFSIKTVMSQMIMAGDKAELLRSRHTNTCKSLVLWRLCDIGQVHVFAVDKRETSGQWPKTQAATLSDPRSQT